MKPSEKLTEMLREIRASYPQLDLLQRAQFAGNLVFMFHVIAASENLLRVAIERSGGDLQAYFAAHLEEERQHEKWLAEDLESIGIKATTTPVTPEAVAMAGAQYYLIFHLHPAALLGYMAVLECFPMAIDDVARLEAVHGAALCRTLRYHAEHDIDHGADVLTMIDKQPEGLLPLIFQNAAQTARYTGAALVRCVQMEH